MSCWREGEGREGGYRVEEGGKAESLLDWGQFCWTFGVGLAFAGLAVEGGAAAEWSEPALRKDGKWKCHRRMVEVPQRASERASAPPVASAGCPLPFSLKDNTARRVGFFEEFR